MREEFESNLSRFELYVNRNIFVPNSIPPPSSQHTVIEPTAADIPPNNQDSLTAITGEVDALKQHYLRIRSAHTRLSNECRNSELLIRDMRTAMFNLRVGAQALEENNIHPLEGTVGNLAQYRQILLKLSNTATGFYFSLLLK